MTTTIILYANPLFIFALPRLKVGSQIRWQVHKPRPICNVSFLLRGFHFPNVGIEGRKGTRVNDHRPRLEPLYHIIIIS